MNHTFSQIPSVQIPRSVFNRSHGHKTTFDAGYLVPFFVDEALPGDTFNLRASLFARLATPLHPFMDNLTMDVFFFAVPNRLVWNNWQKMMGEQIDPGDSIDYLVPTVDFAGGITLGSIFDYFGLPVGSMPIQVSALFSRAYNLIWNEWFRDQNLQDSAVVDKDDGPDSPTDYPIRKRGKRHDYFTSALPWPQKGPGVELPLGTTAPVTITGSQSPTFSRSGNAAAVLNVFNDSVNPLMSHGSSLPQSGPEALVWANPALSGVADLSSASAATINSLRQAFQIQKLLERDARGGTRYTELLRSHFGVVSPDARVQRPEFLGGGSVNVNVNPVTQTSSASGQPTPQGNLAAYGTASGRGLGFTKSFVEHCVIMGLVQVRADLSYQQGLPRMFSRRSRYDFYWPAFAHLGEQAILNKEIFYQGNGDDVGVFGYQERWAEYRYFPSKITGRFRSDTQAGLDIWHLAEDFASLPALNDSFIQDKADVVVDRVIAVPSEPQFLFDSHFELRCTRPMPTYSVPGLIDHF